MQGEVEADEAEFMMACQLGAHVCASHSEFTVCKAQRVSLPPSLLRPYLSAGGVRLQDTSAPQVSRAREYAILAMVLHPATMQKASGNAIGPW